jgi:hypothetical protein
VQATGASDLEELLAVAGAAAPPSIGNARAVGIEHGFLAHHQP